MNMSKLVPNQFPQIPAPYRLAIIGEAPGAEEDACGVPFSGSSGALLNALLTNAGLARSSCFVGNVCQVRPPQNDIASFDYDGPEITAGLAQLTADLQRWRPHLCLLLGNTALRAARGEVASVSDWRGSLFVPSTGPFASLKCMATYHPAAVLRQYEWMPVLRFDIGRAREQALTPELVTPIRALTTPEGDKPAYLAYIVERLRSIYERKPRISIDIEGGVDTMSCISVAESPTDSFIVPFSNANGSFWPTVEDECAVWEWLAKVLFDSNIPKVLQNALYDQFVLAYSYRCPVRGIVDDTMLAHWERYPELEKSLGFQASIYTYEPFYKADRKANDIVTFWRYCCRDSAVTYEIFNKQTEWFAKNPPAKKHYEFNRDLLPAMLYMELRGIRYDYPKALERHAGIEKDVSEEQARLDLLAGHPLNVKSTKQMREFLYEELGLPEVHNRKTGATTANYEAVLGLAKKTGHPALFSILRLRSLRTREQMLRIHPDKDGRIRCSYNLVGTETGRLTCYTSPTGSGFNLQTIPEGDRDLFVADPDCFLFQCDLSGADGWTVAAHCAALGDPTMLDDLRAGVKIAKVIALMFKHGPDVVRGISREQLKALCDTISKSDPLYFGAKCCQHGSNYGMGKVLLSATIFVQSEGAVNIPARDAERLQDLYFQRYPGIRRWHSSVESRLKGQGYIQTASGHIRRFFGRREDHATFKAALADEPQENTTYATNLAAYNLWFDPSNRREDGRLVVEPLHQVHDALVGQFRRGDLDYAKAKLPEWFRNTLVIAGQSIVIPYEGRYGESWGNLNEGAL